jgi:site-specific DNA-methyltransferase (adenine-specific)
VSKITPACIILAHRNGQWSSANASNAARCFGAIVSRLSAILELSALAPVFVSAAEYTLDTNVHPGLDLCLVARKPLSEPTIAGNVLRWGTGAINVDGCRIKTADDLNGGAYSGGSKNPGDASSYFTGTTAGEFNQPPGRWPANVVHDGSDEVLAGFPESSGGAWPAQGARFGYSGGERKQNGVRTETNDSGSAARFFYTAKADALDRVGSSHPTVKPLDLMQWLVRLVTPRGGTVLDPFSGTGTIGEAAFREGMSAVLIEREAEYQDDIRRRMQLVMAGPDERVRESIKARNAGKPPDYGPLFGSVE